MHEVEVSVQPPSAREARVDASVEGAVLRLRVAGVDRGDAVNLVALVRLAEHPPAARRVAHAVGEGVVAEARVLRLVDQKEGAADGREAGEGVGVGEGQAVRARLQEKVVHLLLPKPAAGALGPQLLRAGEERRRRRRLGLGEGPGHAH